MTAAALLKIEHIGDLYASNETSSTTVIISLCYRRVIRTMEHKLQVQLQDDRSACSEKSCDTLKFQELVDKHSGDTLIKMISVSFKSRGGGPRSPKVIKCKISKNIFLTSYVQI